MFGMRPTGFNSFTCSPRLPEGWDQMALRNIHSFGTIFDLEVKRDGKDKVQIVVTNKDKQKNYSVRKGSSVEIRL
jgi:hypothetical protein